MPDDEIEYPLDGTLDLHMFRPAEVKSVVDEYLRVCREQGILRVRIIHGKGSGVLRTIVRARLETCGFVNTIAVADDSSSWGATIATLDPLPKTGD